jgi:uncharacterized protein (TIGR02271 family)
VNGRGENGGGDSRPHSEDELILHEEQARVDKRWEGVGYARVRREVETERVRERHPRGVEEIAHERVPVRDGDSGRVETLPDGSVSIPLYEERLVVTRQTVLRERVIVRKDVVTEWETVEDELRREHVRFETDDVPDDRVERPQSNASRFARARPLSETKPFFLTSEFLLLVAALVGMGITTLVSDSVDAPLFWAITTALVAAYAVSRGSAKAGSEHRTQPYD